jgi:hypothetical protein
MSLYGFAALTSSGAGGTGLGLRLRSKGDMEPYGEELFDDPKFRDEDVLGISEFASGLRRVKSDKSMSGLPAPTP